MKILIVSATKLEIIPFLKKLNYHIKPLESLRNIKIENHTVDILISGIGLVTTTYHLQEALCEQNYDLVLNVGIAGSFSKKIMIGDVVEVTEEQFADLGIEHPTKFETLFEAGFLDENEKPFLKGRLFNDSKELLEIKTVKAISSNTAHGIEHSIENIKQKFNPDIETMEGAAFFYVCLQKEVRFTAIRAISNYVEPRNKENWDVPLALKNLTNVLYNTIVKL